ncbi:MAG: WecB/TagA/CpsF family glycosyltransferase [Scytolyngbya sp. HA4215-MV1]|nr:WecB/TagA/CpsF family glycosyltransferase [Scytolyngbya sp. HA4215-MV1]
MMSSAWLDRGFCQKSVIGCPVTALPFDHQIDLMVKWAKNRISKTVCIANVHMLIEAHRDPTFASVLTSADLVAPDGMPLVWMLRLLGQSEQDRVAGLDVLSALCKQASVEKVSVFFLGSHKIILEKMKARLGNEFPDLEIAGMEPLPFRPLTQQEDAEIIQKLNESGAGVVFVSLGCPKQELWIAEHKDKVHAVMIGLGGAFPVYAGLHKRAPKLIRQAGLEWLYRLLQEPTRLWKRYATTIPVFVWLAFKQLMNDATA